MANFFGFPEFVAGLALLILVWTRSDPVYQFKIEIAPLPLRPISYWIAIFIGIGTLWLDFATSSLNSSELPLYSIWSPRIQLGLASIFLFTVSIWGFFAFIYPVRFSRFNGKRFARAVLRRVERSQPEELRVVADEIARSADKLVAFSNTAVNSFLDQFSKEQPTSVQMYADNVLELIADRRFCRLVVQSTPNVIGDLFIAARDQKKSNQYLVAFGQRVLEEAIKDRDSFLYHELTSGGSNFFQEVKPVSSLLLGHYQIIEDTRFMLNQHFLGQVDWDPDQWNVYKNAVLLALQGWVEGVNKPFESQFCLERVVISFENASKDLYKLEGIETVVIGDLEWGRLRVVIQFIESGVKFLDELVESSSNPEVIDKDTKFTVLDAFGDLLYRVIENASYLRSSGSICWQIHHNTIWSPLFSMAAPDGIASKRVRGIVLNQIKANLEEALQVSYLLYANLLGFCLNVLGFRIEGSNFPEVKEFHSWLLEWTRLHFFQFYETQPDLVDRFFVENIKFDTEEHMLIKEAPFTLHSGSRIQGKLSIKLPE